MVVEEVSARDASERASKPGAMGEISDDRIDRVYAHRFSDDQSPHARWRRDLWKVLVDGFFSGWIAPDATVLDFGCGRGEFINAVSARRRIGVDLRDQVCGALDDDVEFFKSQGPCLPGVETAEIDVLFCSNVLEHLPDRDYVITLLQEFRRVLKPSGRLLVLGPNLRYTGPAYWDFFDHILPFTHHSLAEAFATADLRVERMIPRFLPYTTVGKGTTPLFLVRWYLRVPFAWRVFGAQFFAVARAKA